MANPIIDPGYEGEDPAWIFEGAGTFSSAFPAHGGSWTGYLLGSRSTFGGDPVLITSAVRQGGIVVAPAPTMLRFWRQLYRSDVTTGGAMTVYADLDGNGTFETVLDTIDPSEATVGEWVKAEYIIAPTAGTMGVKVFVAHTDILARRKEWLLDDWEIGVVNRGPWSIYSALYTRLNTVINGAAGGYWLDMAGKWRQRLIRPERSPELVAGGLYACLPLVEPPTIEDQQTGVFAGWRFTGAVYLPDPHPDPLATPLTSSVVEQTAKAMEDIVRCISADWKLSGSASGGRIVSITPEAGIVREDGPQYGMVRFTLEYAERVAPTVLGPGA